MNLFVQQLINGLSWGAIYALIAVGYTMVYGVLRLINFAHGDIYMIGAMVGLCVAQGSFSATAVGSAHPWVWLPASAIAIIILMTLFFFRSKKIAAPRPLEWLGKLIGPIVVSVLVLDIAGRIIRLIGLPSWISSCITLGAAMIVSACLGMVIELVAYRPLRNQPRISTLITAIGVSMFLEFGGQGFFGPTPRSFPRIAPIADTPMSIGPGEISPKFDIHLSWISPRIGTVSASRVDAMIVVVTIVLMTVLTWVVLRTRAGMALRAVSFRFDTAALMGIDINRIITFTFALGSALAGAAGVLVAVRSSEANPLMGLMPGIKAFIAAVLGGIGNIPGAVAGGLLLGLIEVLVSAYLPHGTEYKDAIAFVILIAILMVKPTGIFGRNLVEKV